MSSNFSGNSALKSAVNAIMPFDQLPLELVQKIFVHYCSSIAITDLAVLFNLSPIGKDEEKTARQVTLSLVCSKWREVALNTGELWTEVDVFYNPTIGTCETLEVGLEAIQIWLNRAGSLPITLCVLVGGATDLHIERIAQNLLSPYHIQSLNLRYRESSLLTHKHVDVLPYVEKLSLGTYTRLQALVLFPEMPSLKEFSIRLTKGTSVQDKWNIPWHQLRLLNVCGLPSSFWLNILRSCTKLVTCRVYLAIGSGTPDTGEDVFLPQLEILDILTDQDGSVDTIIRPLILPKVKSLSICTCRTERIPLNPAVFEVISRRSGTGFKHLQSLTLGPLKEPIDVRALLWSMPSLTHIDVHGPLLFTQQASDDISICAIGRHLESVDFGVLTDHQIDLLFKSIRERQKFAATELDIARLSYISVLCLRGSDLEAHLDRSRALGMELGIEFDVERN